MYFSYLVETYIYFCMHHSYVLTSVLQLCVCYRLDSFHEPAPRCRVVVCRNKYEIHTVSVLLARYYWSPESFLRLLFLMVLFNKAGAPESAWKLFFAVSTARSLCLFHEKRSVICNWSPICLTAFSEPDRKLLKRFGVFFFFCKGPNSVHLEPCFTFHSSFCTYLFNCAVESLLTSHIFNDTNVKEESVTSLNVAPRALTDTSHFRYF